MLPAGPLCRVEQPHPALDRPDPWAPKRHNSPTRHYGRRGISGVMPRAALRNLSSQMRQLVGGGWLGLFGCAVIDGCGLRVGHSSAPERVRCSAAHQGTRHP